MYRLPASLRESSREDIRSLVSFLGEIQGNNLFDSHIRHPGTVRTGEGIEGGFVLSQDRLRCVRIEQVLLGHVDEKIRTIVLVPIEERVLRGIQWRTGSVSVLIFFFFIRYFVCSTCNFLSGAISSFMEQDYCRRNRNVTETRVFS